ncbi:hypothetical protein [Lamprobacter modestohalophilus]|nr:hypothetical protein [Lamprobacter modestohalophilus]
MGAGTGSLDLDLYLLMDHAEIHSEEDMALLQAAVAVWADVIP